MRYRVSGAFSFLICMCVAPVLAEDRDPISSAISALIEQGEEQFVLSQKDYGAIRRNGNTYLIPAWFRRKAILSAPTLGEQGTISRVRSGKEIIGFRIESIARGSLLPHLGLHSGDIVRRVNGSALVSEDQALELVTKLSSADEIRIDLERGKERSPVKLTYRVIS